MAGQSCPSSLDSVPAPADRSRRLVDQAESLVLANVQVPVEIAALCQALDVSERTLRKAFQKVHRLPPCRRLRWLRLSHARRALMSVGGSSVTEIATGFGFVELGRFSVEYRKIFGERPSETLRQAMSKQVLKTYAISQ
jgi:AraC family ethanolamine operon transcriptional activator